jgi:hypothetical protein
MARSMPPPRMGGAALRLIRTRRQHVLSEGAGPFNNCTAQPRCVAQSLLSAFNTLSIRLLNPRHEAALGDLTGQLVGLRRGRLPSQTIRATALQPCLRRRAHVTVVREGGVSGPKAFDDKSVVRGLDPIPRYRAHHAWKRHAFHPYRSARRDRGVYCC